MQAHVYAAARARRWGRRFGNYWGKGKPPAACNLHWALRVLAKAPVGGNAHFLAYCLAHSLGNA